MPKGRDYRSAEANAYRGLYGTKRWKTQRLQQLLKEPVCKMCSKRELLTPATVVDHIKPHKGDLVLFWSPSNLQSVCKPCHDSLKQLEETQGFTSAAGDDGWPIDPNHPVNKGKS